MSVACSLSRVGDGVVHVGGLSVQHPCREGSCCLPSLTLACSCSKLPTPRRLWRRPCR